MKRRKGSLLQRMLAVLLAAVLTVGMVSNPMSVRAESMAGQTLKYGAVSVTIPNDMELSVGEESTAAVAKRDGITSECEYNFISSDTSVASVSWEYDIFTVKGISEGTAEITLTYRFRFGIASEWYELTGPFEVEVTAASNPPAKENYMVTVNNGTGGGEYEAQPNERYGERGSAGCN